MKQPSLSYSMFLLPFTIIMPLTSLLCCLVAILVFCLVSSIWWLGLLFLIFAVAILGAWWMIRKYIKERIKEETPVVEPVEEVPAEEVPAEEPVEEPVEEVPAEEPVEEPVEEVSAEEPVEEPVEEVPAEEPAEEPSEEE